MSLLDFYQKKFRSQLRMLYTLAILTTILSVINLVINHRLNESRVREAKVERFWVEANSRYVQCAFQLEEAERLLEREGK